MSKELGRSIRQARTSAKLTQQFVADELSVSRAAVGMWETGQHEPSTENLLALCVLLKIDVQELVHGIVRADRGVEQPPFDLGPRPNPDAFLFLKDQNEKPFSQWRPQLKLNLHHAQPSDDRHFFVSRESFEEIPRPLGMLNEHDGYALSMPDDLMFPKFDYLETLFVRPKRRPIVGEYIVVNTGNISSIADQNSGRKLDVEQCFIGRLSKFDIWGIELEHFNPFESFRVERTPNTKYDEIIPLSTLIPPAAVIASW